MSQHKAVPTKAVAGKLRKLTKLLPKEDPTVWKFGTFLADRLNPSIRPSGFVMGCMLTITDLRRGYDGHAGKSLDNELVGREPEFYNSLRASIPTIAKAVFPEDFAGEVEIFYARVLASME